MLERLVFFSSTASCFLLSIAVFARLTGFDLAYSGIVAGRLPQSLLFFGFLNLVLWLAASAAARVVLSQGCSILGCTAYAVGASTIVIGVILVACWRMDGHLGDLPQFLRFEVARSTSIVAPFLAVLSYALAGRLTAPRLPAGNAARWLKTGIALSVALAALAAAFYLWDKMRPWSDPMPEQLLVVTCGLIGPAFVLAVVSMSQRDVARVGAAFGVVGLTLIAAWL